MKIATWNVNSLKIRLPQILQWLENYSVDILCLQETKITNDKIPLQEINAAGYVGVFSGQKTYNGVAILARNAITNVIKNNPLFDDEQQRLLSATIDGIRVICIYVPNGQSIYSVKYQYKLKWLDALYNWLVQQKQQYTHLVLLGDYNIAPKDCDVYNSMPRQENILVSNLERAAFIRLQNLGLIDAFRLFKQVDKSYSWWDYRKMCFYLNRGLRIDHILLSPSLATQCTSCMIDIIPRTWKKPSDHAPVIATFKI